MNAIIKLLATVTISLVAECSVASPDILSPPRPGDTNATYYSVLAPMTAFQKGIAYASWWHGEYSSYESDQMLSGSLKSLSANWIQIIVTCYQKKITSTMIQCLPETRTPTDSDLTHVIYNAHRLGFRVMLKPHLDLADDAKHWRGEIDYGKNEAARKAWFKSYTEFITHYASLAQKTDADYFVVGTELTKTTNRSKDWRNVIRAVRSVYHGRLTYAAHHAGEAFSINWWDTLDAIGINPYYTLAMNDRPTVSDIKAAWDPIVVQLGSLSKKWKRPVILTEIGYESVAGAIRSPWKAEGQTIDFEEQANSYQALFEAFSGQEWWQGVFWWVWRVKSPQTVAYNSDYIVRNKPAENVLGYNYSEQPRKLLCIACVGNMR